MVRIENYISTNQHKGLRAVKNLATFHQLRENTSISMSSVNLVLCCIKTNVKFNWKHKFLVHLQTSMLI